MESPRSRLKLETERLVLVVATFTPVAAELEGLESLARGFKGTPELKSTVLYEIPRLISLGAR